MQNISLQDTILYPSPIHQSVEHFASLGNRCYTVLSQEESSTTVKQSADRAFWSAIALRIVQIALLPLTLLALTLKIFWRSSIVNQQPDRPAIPENILTLSRTSPNDFIILEGISIYGIVNPRLSFHQDGLCLRNKEGTNVIRISRDFFCKIKNRTLLNSPETNYLRFPEEHRTGRRSTSAISFKRSRVASTPKALPDENAVQIAKTQKDLTINFLSSLLSIQLGKSERRRIERQRIVTNYSIVNSIANTALNSAITLIDMAYFTPLLFKRSKSLFFPNTGLDFKDSLSEFRTRYRSEKSEEDTLLGYHIMTKLPMLMMADALMSPKLSKEESPLLSELLKSDIRNIKTELDRSEAEGTLRRNFNKLKACINIFDPHLNGNLPFHVGAITINGHRTDILRHAVPTNETLSVGVTEEYIAFLEQCVKTKEKVLYNCLLSPNKLDEKARIKALLGLQNSHSPYRNTFYFARFPLDGELEELAIKKQEDEHFITLRNYKKLIETEIEKAIDPSTEQDLTGQFIFSNALKQTVRNNYKKTLNWSYIQVSSLSSLNEIEKKQVFMMLFCTALKYTILEGNKINYYNNTCKDAIDRGAVHLISDLLLNGVLTDTLEANKNTLRILASAPAFIAKTQAVLKDRASWYIALAKWAENIRVEEMKESYEQTFNLDIEPVQFNIEEPLLNQTDLLRNQLFQSKERTFESILSIEEHLLTDNELLKEYLKKLFTPLDEASYTCRLSKYYSKENTTTAAFLIQEEEFIVRQYNVTALLNPITRLLQITGTTVNLRGESIVF